MTAAEYFLCFLAFSMLGTAFLFLILIFQRWLPGGPDASYLTTPMTADLAANTAVSFSTTTTWQAYAGETTLRYFTQVFGLAVQNFLAGAAGLAVGLAFIRGFAREGSATLGNFWVDLVRSLLWVLIPLSWVGGLFLVWQGVPLNLTAYVQAHTREGSVQTIAQGPVAVLELIKNLGTNGGGFYNANGAHPYENPTPLTNFVEMLAIAVIPASFPVLFGRMVGRPRAGWLLLASWWSCLSPGWSFATVPRVPSHGAGRPCRRWRQHGGKRDTIRRRQFGAGRRGDVQRRDGVVQLDARFVSPDRRACSARQHAARRARLRRAGNRSVQPVDDCPGGRVPGRPDGWPVAGIRGQDHRAYRGEAGCLLRPDHSACRPAAGGMGRRIDRGPRGPGHQRRRRGFTEIVFAYASCMANNGQNMAGLNANSAFYNITTILAMLAGRFVLAALALELAGRFARQGRKAETTGTLPSDTITFGILVLGTVLLIGALSFLPVLALGPIAEYLKTAAGV